MQPQPQTFTDTQLLHAWRAGDRHAGQELLAKHWPSISRYFTRKFGPHCEDLIQDTFTACIESMHRFRGDSSFRVFLFGVARHILLRHIRNKMRDDNRRETWTMTIPDDARSCTSIIEADRTRQLLLRALQDLPIDTQTMLELHYWEKMPVQEIAGVVDMPVNTVKCRMRRGRLQLAKALEAGHTKESPSCM